MNGEIRCRPGDLAIVVRDEPGCEGNLGRIVEVDGPLQVNLKLGLACWLIRPICGVLWTVTEPGGCRMEFVNGRSRIEHPDAWLLPVQRDEALSLEEMEVYRKMQERIDAALIEIGAVRLSPQSEDTGAQISSLCHSSCATS